MQNNDDNRRFPLSPEKKNAIFWLTVISLTASIPYLSGYNIAGTDVPYCIPWADEWYPVYGVVLNIATAWMSYVCFSRIFRKQNIGIICSALYTLSVFRIYKLYVIGAVGESSAITFIPLVLYGLYRIFTEDPEGKKYKTAWVPFTLGISGAVQFHVLSCEIICAAVIFFCVAYIRKLFSRKIFLALLKGILSSLLVSLWPLSLYFRHYLTQGKSVSAQTIQDRGLYFAQLAFHFWTVSADATEGNNGMRHSSPVGVGLILIAALGVFLILWFSGKIRKPDGGEGCFAKTAAVSGLLWLFMSMNIFPWDRIQAFSSVTASFVDRLEFPDRFLGWGTVCLVLVFGYCLWYFESHGKQFCHGLMVGAAVIGITTSSMYLLDHVSDEQGSFGLYHQESVRTDPLPESVILSDLFLCGR